MAQNSTNQCSSSVLMEGPKVLLSDVNARPLLLVARKTLQGTGWMMSPQELTITRAIACLDFSVRPQRDVAEVSEVAATAKSASNASTRSPASNHGTCVKIKRQHHAIVKVLQGSSSSLNRFLGTELWHMLRSAATNLRSSEKLRSTLRSDEHVQT